jgi:hypothetical protein
MQQMFHAITLHPVGDADLLVGCQESKGGPQWLVKPFAELYQRHS